MQGTLRVVRAETHRLLRTRATWLGALVLLVAPALRVLAARTADLAEHAGAVRSALTAGRQPPPPPPPGNAFGPLVDGWNTGLVLGAVVLLGVGARCLAADRELGLLRVAVTRSVSRAALVWGRALLGVPLVLAVVVLSGVGAAAAAGAWYEFGPLVEQGYELMTRAELVHELLRALVAVVPPLVALWCFGLLVSSASRSGAGALLAGFGGVFVTGLFDELLGEGRAWLFTTFTPAFGDKSCMAEMSGVARGLSDAGLTPALYDMNLLVPLPEALLMTAVAGWILTRRSL